MGEPADDHGRDLGGAGDEVAQDLAQKRKIGHVIRGMRGEGRLLSFDGADDLHAERMKGSRLDRHTGARCDPLGHFRGGIAREGQKQDLLGVAQARLDQIGRLRGDDAGLARSRPGQNQCRIFVDHDGQALFRGEGFRLDRVEDVLPSCKLRRHEPIRRRRTRPLWIGGEGPDRGQPSLGFRLEGLWGKL